MQKGVLLGNRVQIYLDPQDELSSASVQGLRPRV